MTVLELTPAPGIIPALGQATERRPVARHWVVFTALVILAFFALIYSRTALDDSAFLVQQLESGIADEEARYWQLRLEVAELQAPDRIAEEAARLGLIYPAGGPVPLDVPGVVRAEPSDLDDRWAQIKSILSAQP